MGNRHWEENEKSGRGGGIVERLGVLAPAGRWDVATGGATRLWASRNPWDRVVLIVSCPGGAKESSGFQWVARGWSMHSSAPPGNAVN